MEALHAAAFVAIAACLEGCALGRTILHNSADLDDHRIFANRTVQAPARASPLRRAPDAGLAALVVPGPGGRPSTLSEYLEGNRMAAFVVLRGDTLVLEHYGRGFDERSLFNSLSIAKAIVGTLAGVAVQEGRLALDDTVGRHRPELAATPYGTVTVRELITMTSGVGDAPSWLPGRAQYYYGGDLHDAVARASSAEAGRRWRYSEGDIQALGFVLEAATGRHLSDYLSDTIWKPLGMEAPALWSLDREDGMEKAFCCVSARARDFARFGRLYLDGGLSGGARVLHATVAHRETVHGVPTGDGYVHQQLWWTPPGSGGDFYAYGHNGQYLYVNPAARTVIVQFSAAGFREPTEVFRVVAAAVSGARTETAGLTR